jgi:glucan endo-1,3-beta-D-glucosidase
MHRGVTSLAFAAAISSALAAFQGFNYGSTFNTGAAKMQADFEAEFKTAQGLIGAPGVFNSARLYTMVVSTGRLRVITPGHGARS